ncbi:MAG TPA: tetratricopeptide repeat protein [Terriglobales bacterium]|jgi:tetratricopeptide (TPR) repeat protein
MNPAGPVRIELEEPSDAHATIQNTATAVAPDASGADAQAYGLISQRALFLLLGAIALVYAAASGLRTVSDYDVGWQLASGRWMAQHHRIFSTDVFSYTAYGQPWIYPIGAGLIFYAAYVLGGYGLLSWIGAIACAGTVALLLRRGSLATALLAILAIPLIAYRTIPRADMFTVVLFAAFLSILWENFQTGRARLWPLPLLMIAWVNLHLGFVAGLGLVFAFAGFDLLELLLGEARRQNAIQRLKRELPWFVATAAATIVNPWGWGLYTALLRQNQAMAEHARFLTEWFALPINWTVISSSLSFRDPQGTVYLVLAIAVVAAVLAIVQRQPGAALLLTGAGYESIRHIRMEALTACVVVLAGGSVLQAAASAIAQRISNARVRQALTFSIAGLFVVLGCVRLFDVVSNRTYLIRDHVATFGAGIGWWYPEAAARFIEESNLPGEIINTYDEGGFVLWSLGEHHRDYIDGRAIPFGTSVFENQLRLMAASPDATEWQRVADRYHINTFILSLERRQKSPLSKLKDFCSSRNWRPVYLDEVAAVFVRRTPETEDLIRRSQIDCATVALPVQPLPASPAIAFDRWANAAAVLAALNRNTDALAASEHALAIFPDSSYVHWLRGNVFYAMWRNHDAEEEYLRAVALDPSEDIWSSLGLLYYRMGRLPEATHAMQQAARLSLQPYTAYLRLAYYYLNVTQPQQALTALDQALRAAPSVAVAENGPDSLRLQVARARSDAWRMSGDTARAITAGEDVVHLSPDDAAAWSNLAHLYERAGRVADQQRAEQQAAQLGSGGASGRPRP